MAEGETETRALAADLWTGISIMRKVVRKVAGRPSTFRALTGAELELVRAIRQKPLLTVAEAAGELGLARNTISTLVGKLVASGAIERREDPLDRRIARLQLSADVRKEVDAWEARRIVALTAALQELSAADREALARALPALERAAIQLDVT